MLPNSFQFLLIQIVLRFGFGVSARSPARACPLHTTVFAPDDAGPQVREQEQVNV